jgi:sigma-B regulation protein RsbU (phosphoserine phosphatase)
VEYGDAQLSAALASAGASPNPDRVIATVVQDVKRFVRGAPQSDDITCLGLKYLGPEAK